MAGILLVEDDPDTRRMLEAWLQWMGHDVFGAASATEAVHLVEGSTQVPAPALHVAVLDIVMPDHSGVELLQYLRRRPVTRQIPAIFLSASELDTDRAAARALGAHFVPKPVTRSVLQAAVESALITYT
ncbi:response regulator [Kineosporia rhizophila]|uniref:response regulator n=1 Tax=Kineosporia rhizophila TaxID=84633 RepID=UPI001E55EB61|nr:response regulator [Kineosporia rhizophila]MCE0536215.1 response regulator [Kineosporia rhizophila]